MRTAKALVQTELELVHVENDFHAIIWVWKMTKSQGILKKNLSGNPDRLYFIHCFCFVFNLK